MLSLLRISVWSWRSWRFGCAMNDRFTLCTYQSTLTSRVVWGVSSVIWIELIGSVITGVYCLTCWYNVNKICVNWRWLTPLRSFISVQIKFHFYFNFPLLVWLLYITGGFYIQICCFWLFPNKLSIWLQIIPRYPQQLPWCPVLLLWCHAILLWCPVILLWCPVILLWCPVHGSCTNLHFPHRGGSLPERNCCAPFSREVQGLKYEW